MEEETMELRVAVADDATHRLDPRWVSYQRRVALLSSSVLALVLLGAAAAAVLLADLPATPVLAAVLTLTAVNAALRLWWPGLAYRHASYRLGRRALEIRRGVLFRRVIDVPRSRIQHSDVSQGPLERLHGLGTLSVHTAGTRHSRVQLPGLEHRRALAIRDHLMQTAEDDVV